MSMFSKEGFDLMQWLAQGREAGIDFTQLARPRPRGGEPHFDAFWDEPVYGPEVDTSRPRPSEPPPNQSMFEMLDALSSILDAFPQGPQGNPRPPVEGPGIPNWDGPTGVSGGGSDIPRPRPDPGGYRPPLLNFNPPPARHPERPRPQVNPRTQAPRPFTRPVAGEEGNPRPVPQEGRIPYERRATDNYEGFYSEPYAPLKEGMTKRDLGKIIAGNLGASAGFR